ncbi:Phosphoserine phosphatase RsbP [Phycisphaerae bacterium RAS1]|nr:Phosphoserine phosphatase RsbP [Phycisphaerae bacterium RAS1]
MPSIVVRSKTGLLGTFELSRRPLTLGRADNCDIVLRNDAEVSREHAQIWLDESGNVVVADRKSKNGTRVDDGDVFHNETRIATRTVRIGEHDVELVGVRGAGRTSDVKFLPDTPTHLGSTRYFPSSKQLDLSNQRLQLLMSLTARIGGVFERKQLLEQAVDACCEALQFERALIALKTARGDTEAPITRNIGQDENGAYKVSRTLINKALVYGERAIVNNPATDVENLSESMVRFPICSALCVPILHRDEVLGVIYGDRVTRGSISSYSPSDVDFLAAIAQQVGVGTSNLRLLQEHVRSQKMFASLEQARGIQQRLLPAEPLEMGRVRVEGYNEPSSAVSGDYFDYFDLGDGRIGLIIADVTGHGLPAALMMANLQAAVQVALTPTTSLPDLAARMNKLVCQNTASNVFITAILGWIDSNTGTLEFVSCGHPAPILITHDGGIIEFADSENALPLGVLPDDTYHVRRIGPERGVTAGLFFTDGLIEAADPAGTMLGSQPVIRNLLALPERTTDAIIESTLKLVRGHLGGRDNADDLTLLALRLK